MKKTFLVSMLLIAAILLSSCDYAVKQLGGFTPAEYGVQATQIAQDKVAAEKQANVIATLTADKATLEKQVEGLAAAKKALATDLDNYKALICEDHSWELMKKTGVIVLASGNKDLAQIEKDTQVSFYLTQWVLAGKPEIPNLGYWVLTVDWYNGIALDQAKSCVILDPAKWSGVAK